MFNILYKGRKLYQNLTFEECTDIFDELAHKFYEGENIDLNELEMEEI